MSSTKQVRLAGACAAVATLALAISCSGFFVNPTLTGVSVGPSGVVLALSTAAPTFPMTATGTYSDGSQKTLTSGVVWSSDTPTVASVGQSSGLVTGIAPGSANITASSGGCSACSGSTAVKVVLGTVTSITVTPSTQSVTIGGSPAIFTATASPGGVDITSTSTWTLQGPGGVDQTSNFTLTYVAGSGEAILPSSTAVAQTYTVVVTYTTVKNTSATLTVN